MAVVYYVVWEKTERQLQRLARFRRFAGEKVDILPPDEPCCNNFHVLTSWLTGSVEFREYSVSSWSTANPPPSNPGLYFLNAGYERPDGTQENGLAIKLLYCPFCAAPIHYKEGRRLKRTPPRPIQVMREDIVDSDTNEVILSASEI